MRKSARNPISVEIDERQIRRALSPFGVSVNDDQLRKIREYLGLLLQWNRAMGLTTVTEPMEIARRHFGESMFAANLVHVEIPVENCRLADVGTGAGFPGLALKVALPDIQAVLIESNRKKCAFLAEVARRLEFEGVEILAERFEEIRPERITANVITARALGDFGRLLKWAEQALTPKGSLLLWLGAEDATRIAKEGRWSWQPPVHIPDSQRRYILVGRPLAGHPESD